MKPEIVEELARAITMVFCEQHEDCKSLPDAIRIGAVPIIDRLVSEAREWQPIATAPKDGTVVDIWVPQESPFESYRIADAYWRGGQKRGQWWAPNFDYDGLDGPTGETPTHWMPLPAPPETDHA